MGWILAGFMVAVGKVVFVADGVGVRVGLFHRVGVVVGVLEGVKVDVGMGVAEQVELGLTEGANVLAGAEVSVKITIVLVILDEVQALIRTVVNKKKQKRKVGLPITITQNPPRF